jgi:hypothetical protein
MSAAGFAMVRQMNDRRVDHFLQLLKQTAEELRSEAQRLLGDLQDPEKQQRVKESIRELGTWARQTAEELTEIVDRAVRRAEGAITGAAARVGVKVPPRRPVAPVEPPAAPKATRKRAPQKRTAAAKAVRKKKR